MKHQDDEQRHREDHGEILQDEELLHRARLVFGVLRELAAHPGSRCVTTDYDACRDGAHLIRVVLTVEKKTEACKVVAPQ